MLFFIISSVFLLLAPYTKVEESFNIQATHDLLVYSPFNTTEYDHLVFSGVVPRTFVAPVYLFLLASPVKLFINNKTLLLIVARLALLLTLSFTLSQLSKAVVNKFGRSCAFWFQIFNAINFHLLFWGSRTLPNIIALCGSNMAFAYWIAQKDVNTVELKQKVAKNTSKKANLRKETQAVLVTKYRNLYLIIMTATTAIFRCELVILFGPIILAEIFLWKSIEFFTAFGICYKALSR